VRGITLVLVLHDLNRAARYCDRLVMIAGGAVAASGAPAEVLTEQRVQDVFGLDSRIITDPVSGTPLMLPIGRHHATAGPAA
jgi:iron complex transport system ATP-binding protein